MSQYQCVFSGCRELGIDCETATILLEADVDRPLSILSETHDDILAYFPDGTTYLLVTGDGPFPWRPEAVDVYTALVKRTGGTYFVSSFLIRLADLPDGEMAQISDTDADLFLQDFFSLAAQIESAFRNIAGRSRTTNTLQGNSDV